MKTSTEESVDGGKGGDGGRGGGVRWGGHFSLTGEQNEELKDN